jgi:hypothetical protein
MCVELKIKSKHLSEEAKIIRFEEEKLRHKNRDKFFSLREHRKLDVRNENRATFLARAFLAGKAYKTVERKVHDLPKLYYSILPRVLAMVNKYGTARLTKQDIVDWFEV